MAPFPLIGIRADPAKLSPGFEEAFRETAKLMDLAGL